MQVTEGLFYPLQGPAKMEECVNALSLIIGIDENEDFQLKGSANIFNKIIDENFPNLKKEMPMNIQEAYRTPNRLDQKRNSSRHIVIRTTNALKKDKILKAVRGKGQVTYKGRHIRITPDFSQRL